MSVSLSSSRQQDGLAAYSFPRTAAVHFVPPSMQSASYTQQLVCDQASHDRHYWYTEPSHRQPLPPLRSTCILP